MRYRGSCALCLGLVTVSAIASANESAQLVAARSPVANVQVVNVGGPFNGQVVARGQRSDFRHVDLERAANTVIANVNTIDLSTIFGQNVRFLRASNVPFVPVRSGKFVKPEVFVEQARRLGARNLVVTTGIHSVNALVGALKRGGYGVRIRRLGQNSFVTARRRK